MADLLGSRKGCEKEGELGAEWVNEASGSQDAQQPVRPRHGDTNWGYTQSRDHPASLGWGCRSMGILGSLVSISGTLCTDIAATQLWCSTDGSCYEAVAYK